jgi:subtilase family serine protease
LRRAGVVGVLGILAGCSRSPAEGNGGRAAAAVAGSSTGSALRVTSKGGLPDRVHRRKDGRYVRDVCDHHQRFFCFSHVLLPPEWKPGDDPFVKLHGAHPAFAGPLTGDGGVAQGTYSSLGMQPSDVLAAYNIPSASKANGAIVAVVDEPDSNAFSDMNDYRTNYGLAALPQCAAGTHGGYGATPCFSQLASDGTASTGGDTASSDDETSLDIDMISAACPDCSIMLVEFPKSTVNFVQAAQTAVTLGAVATSISWGASEGGDMVTGFTTPGHLVLAASGDYAYDDDDSPYGLGASYPASAPDILAVGGTELLLKSGTAGSGTYAEAVWNDSVILAYNGYYEAGYTKDVTTSGCSATFPIPSWQVSAVNGACGSGSSAFRATVDLSGAADYWNWNAITEGYFADETGIAIYDTASGGYGWGVTGTSAAAPLVAGILARLGMATQIADAMSGAGGISLYASTTMAAFNDLGSSSYPVDSNGFNTNSQNGCSPSVLCTAGTGWDGPSGVGTPNGAKLAALRGATSTGRRAGHGRPL